MSEASAIRGYIVDSFLLGVDDPSLTDDSSLIDGGVLDSTGVVELVSYLEETFDIEIADDDLVPENLDSIARLVAFVETKRAAGAPTS